MMRAIQIWLAVLCVSMSTGTWAASFDCALAKTASEKTICADPELSALDDALAKVYADTATKADKAALMTDQLRWLKTRNRCSDSVCLAAAYRKRVEDLSHWLDEDVPFLTSEQAYSTNRNNFIFNSETQKNDPFVSEDCLTVTPKSPTQIEFGLSLVGANAHTCDMAGIADRQGDGATFVYRETIDRSPDEPLRCTLLIHFKKGYVALEDRDLNCRQNYCGMRAGIDGVGFPRSPGNCQLHGSR